MSNHEFLVQIIQDNFNNLRQDMNSRLDRIDEKFDGIEEKLNTFVKIEDCKKNRQYCIENLNLEKTEMSIKKVSAIGGVVTGTIAASSVIVVAILKIFYVV